MQLLNWYFKRHLVSYNFHRHYLYTVYFVAALTSQMYLYHEEGRDIQWNIAWAQVKPKGFPSPPPFGQCPNQSWFFLGIASLRQYWKNWAFLFVWQLGLYFPVLPSRWSNTGPYRFSRELCCGSTTKYRSHESNTRRVKFQYFPF